MMQTISGGLPLEKLSGKVLKGLMRNLKIVLSTIESRIAT